MKVNDWLSASIAELKLAGIATARLDALVLLEDATNKNRAWLLAHSEFELDNTILKKLDKQIRSRAEHEPLAFIRGKTEFYGREFILNSKTLEPRPESETMIDLLLQLEINESVIVDVGTGSGALAVTAQLELPKCIVLATEIDNKAAEVAKQNFKKYNLSISLTITDLLKDINQKLDIILANLPYVPDDYQINQAALMEPRIAIFGGKDGLDLYRRLFAQLKISKLQPQYIFTESLPFQHKVLYEIAKSHGYSLLKVEDFIQVFEPTS